MSSRVGNSIGGGPAPRDPEICHLLHVPNSVDCLLHVQEHGRCRLLPEKAVQNHLRDSADLQLGAVYPPETELLIRDVAFLDLFF